MHVCVCVCVSVWIQSSLYARRDYASPQCGLRLWLAIIDVLPEVSLKFHLADRLGSALHKLKEPDCLPLTSVMMDDDFVSSIMMEGGTDRPAPKRAGGTEKMDWPPVHQDRTESVCSVASLFVGLRCV